MKLLPINEYNYKGGYYSSELYDSIDIEFIFEWIYGGDANEFHDHNSRYIIIL